MTTTGQTIKDTGENLRELCLACGIGALPWQAKILMLCRIFSPIWSRETAVPYLQSEWNENDRAFGQSDVTALAVQEILGGNIILCRTTEGSLRYINEIPVCQNDAYADLGHMAYGSKVMEMIPVKTVAREDLLKGGPVDTTVATRYETFQRRLVLGLRLEIARQAAQTDH